MGYTSPMTTRSAQILVSAIIITLAVAGVLAWENADTDTSSVQTSSSLSSPRARSSIASSESAGRISMSSAYNPMTDPEHEGSPAYEAAERESLKNVDRATAIAKAFVFKGVPANYVEYCPPKGGFCFSYPPSWGTPSWNSEDECSNRDDLIGFSGFFMKPGTQEPYPFFGASVFTYASFEECVPQGRGGSVLDWMPKAETASEADATIVTKNGVRLPLWYGYEVGWLTHRYEMGFAAPTSHNLVKRIAFVGVKTSDPETTKEDIEEFLTVAHSYRVVPVSD